MPEKSKCKKKYDRSRLSVFLMVIVYIIMMFVPVAWADDLEEIRRQRSEIEERIRAERDTLQAQRTREEQLKTELSALDKQLQDISGELAKLNSNIDATEKEIKQTESELAEAEVRLAYQESLLMTRLRVIHEQGTISYIEVLLAASSFADFLTRFFNLRIIAENDLMLLEEVEAERNNIARKKEELEKKKAELEAMRGQVVAKKEEVEQIKATRAAVLAELQDEIRQIQQIIRDKEADAAKLAEEIKEIIARRERERLEREREGRNDRPRPGGKLAWPVESPWRITSPFGFRSDPFTGGRAFHGGVDIATFGQPNQIFAAEAGEVLFARFSSGYGNYIMIDHGGNLMTLYAHLSVMRVSAGQQVSRGQTIGLAGTTGRSTGVHLHFEVWEGSNRVNPMGYL